MSDETRVFVIDDHPLVRAGLAKVISSEPGYEFCGELGSGRGAVDAVLKARPDVILLDLSMKDCSGLELIKDFRSAGIESLIIVVSMHDEVLYAERVLRAGANGYLMKEEATERIIEGIRTVIGGDIYLSESMKRLMLKRMAGGAQTEDTGYSLSQLTDREFEVFELIGKGMSPRDIAKHLGISPKTVDAHRANMKDKLGFASGAELIRYAIRWVETGERREMVER